MGSWTYHTFSCDTCIYKVMVRVIHFSYLFNGFPCTVLYLVIVCTLRRMCVLLCVSQVGRAGLFALASLTQLQHLDVSYTEVTDLTPVILSCPHLRGLNLSECRSLNPASLELLLQDRHAALPQLKDLDVSYCPLPANTVRRLLCCCSWLESLALNGCEGMTCDAWGPLNDTPAAHVAPSSGQLLGPTTVVCESGGFLSGVRSMRVDDVGVEEGLMQVSPLKPALTAVSTQTLPTHKHTSDVIAHSESNAADNCSMSSGRVVSHALQSLSLVRCSALKSLCLGLVPASGKVNVLQPKHYLLTADRQALQNQVEHYDWIQVPTVVSGLRLLRLGLSGVQVVALALPHLMHLDLNSCSQLRVLELRCPLLLTLHLQACRAVPVKQLVLGLTGCPALETLDMQHTNMEAGMMMALKQQHPSLQNLQLCPRACALCVQRSIRRCAGAP